MENVQSAGTTMNENQPINAGGSAYFTGAAVQGIDTSLLRTEPKTEKPFGKSSVPWLALAESNIPVMLKTPFSELSSWENFSSMIGRLP
jgi:hypothetical protein